MPELRRLAMAAESPDRLAEFYHDVFDLENIGTEKGAIFLFEGDFNLALLPVREGTTPGFSDLGFQMARLESIEKNAH